MHTIMDSITVLPVDEVIARKAVDSKFLDFEDAMQYFAAADGNVDIIVTRNKKDYSKGRIAIMTAEEFVTSYGANPDRPEV